MFLLFHQLVLSQVYTSRGAYEFTFGPLNRVMQIRPQGYDQLYVLLLDEPLIAYPLVYRNLKTRVNKTSSSIAVKLVSNYDYDITYDGYSSVRIVLWITEPSACDHPIYAKGDINYKADFVTGATKVCTFIYYKDFNYQQSISPDYDDYAIVVFSDGTKSTERSGISHKYAYLKLNKTVYYSYSYKISSTYSSDRILFCESGDFTELSAYSSSFLPGYHSYTCNLDTIIAPWVIAVIVICIILALSIPVIIYCCCCGVICCTAHSLMQPKHEYNQPILEPNQQMNYTGKDYPQYQQQQYPQYQQQQYPQYQQQYPQQQYQPQQPYPQYQQQQYPQQYKPQQQQYNPY